MKYFNLFFLAIALSALMVACEMKPNTSADIEPNKQLTEKWDEAINKGDLEALVSLYAEDAIRMQPNEPAQKGREAIRASFKSYLGNNETKDDNITADVKLSGDYAIVWGTYTADYTPNAGGNPVHDQGKWVCIQKRQADGSWKITMDIWNSDLPPVALQ